MMSDFRYLVTMLIMFTVSFAFIGGDCGTDEDPPPAGGLAAPTNLNLSLDAIPGGSSFAVLSWNSSANENDANFRGYRISTYLVDSAGTVGTSFQSVQVQKTTRTHSINNIERGTRYRTYVLSELNDGTRSDSVATPIYGGIYYNNNGSIDEFMASGPAESGYGWNLTNGAGSQYAYTAGNASMIDIHLRRESGGQLILYSPNLQSPGSKTTLFRLIGTGDDAFKQTNLEEPNLTSINLNDEEVYLVRTNEQNYVKIWVRNISDVSGTPPYSNVQFEYKLQPIEGMRVLKR